MNGTNAEPAGGAGVEAPARSGPPADVTARLLERVEHIGRAVERLERASAAMPTGIATAVDVFDEWAARLASQGVDIEKGLRQGLHAALWLGQRVSEAEFERLGILLRSDVLEPHALAVVGKTGRALAACHEGACDTQAPDRMGLMGLLRALRDPDVQRTLAFVVRVARCFGGHLQDPADIPPSPIGKSSPC